MRALEPVKMLIAAVVVSLPLILRGLVPVLFIFGGTYLVYVTEGQYDLFSMLRRGVGVNMVIYGSLDMFRLMINNGGRHG